MHGMSQEHSRDSVFIGTGQDAYFVDSTVLLAHTLRGFIPNKSEVNKSDRVSEVVYCNR